MPDIYRCTSADGAEIAYTSFGAGPPLLLTMSWATTIEAQLASVASAPFYERLGAARRVVMYDRRGVGGSERDVADLSMLAQLADVQAVTAALGIERCDLLGDNDGCYIAVAWAAAHPERVARLVLWSPLVAGRDARPEQLRSFAQVMRADWPEACRRWAQYRVAGEEERQALAEALAGMVSSSVAASYLEWESDQDATELLPRVNAPALVISARRLGPRSLGVASLLAAARFVAVDSPEGAAGLDLGDVAALVIDHLECGAD